MKLAVRILQTECGRYKAVCPALPGCMSTGKTPQEAEHKLEDAIRGYIAAVSNFVPDNVTQEVTEVSLF